MNKNCPKCNHETFILRWIKTVTKGEVPWARCFECTWKGFLWDWNNDKSKNNTEK